MSHERGVYLLQQEFICLLLVLLDGQDIIKKSHKTATRKRTGKRKFVKKCRGGKSWLEKWAYALYKFWLNLLKIWKVFWKVKDSRWFLTWDLGLSYFHLFRELSYPLHFCKIQKIHGSEKQNYSPVRQKYFVSIWGSFSYFPPQFQSQIFSLAVKQPHRNWWNSIVKLKSLGKD